MITIDKLDIDFRMENLPFARQLYGEWDAFFRTSIEKVINDTLSFFDNEDEILEINSLEIELDPLAEPEFYSKFPNEFSRKLKELFSALLLKKDDPSQKTIRITPSQKSQKEIFFHFLIYGYIPTTMSAVAHSIDSLWNSLIESNDPSLTGEISRHWKDLNFRKRMVLQSDDKQLQGLVNLLLPEENQFIEQFTSVTIRSQAHSEYSYIPQNDYRVIVWLFVFSYIFRENLGAFNRKSFVKTLVSELASHYNLDENVLFRTLFNELGLLPASGYTNELLQVLNEIANDRIFRNPPSDTQSYLKEIEAITNKVESQFIEQFVTITIESQSQSDFSYIPQSDYRTIIWRFVWSYLSKKNRDSFNRSSFVKTIIGELAAHYNLDINILFKALFHTVSLLPTSAYTNELILVLNEVAKEKHDLTQKNIVMNNTTNFIPKNENENQSNRFEVNNAGLVLLSPYFRRLFEMLGVLNEEKKEFVNDESRVKAIFLLQYLLNETKTEYSENELILNKLLTNSLHLPLPMSVELTEKEKEIGLSLINAAKNNWAKLKNTSVVGFREVFLIRNGILEKKDDHWELKVEEKAYDILLDSIPWNFRMIHYPWLEDYIKVIWRG